MTIHSVNYDDLNAAWKLIEDRIASLGCPYEVAVEAGDGRNLAWAWVKGEFRVCVIQQDGDFIAPVLDSKFINRIELVDFVGSLEDAIISRLEEARREALAATKKLTNYLAAVRLKGRGVL